MGIEAAGFYSRWRTVLLQLTLGYLSYAFTIFKTKLTVVEKLKMQPRFLGERNTDKALPPGEVGTQWGGG